MVQQTEVGVQGGFETAEAVPGESCLGHAS